MSEKKDNRLGDLIRRAREGKGWSLQLAADLIGCSRGYLHDLETGVSRNPGLDIVAGLVIAYNLPAEAIIACAIRRGE